MFCGDNLQVSFYVIFSAGIKQHCVGQAEVGVKGNRMFTEDEMFTAQTYLSLSMFPTVEEWETTQDLAAEPEESTVATRLGARQDLDAGVAGVLDAATSRAVETAVNVGLLPAIVVMGVSTNVISMIVFARQSLKDRINLCLFSLALADAGYLLSLFSYKFFSLLSLVSENLGAYWKIRSLNTVIGVYWGFSSTSNVLTMVVSLERCVCVVSPLKSKKILTTRAMFVAILVVYIFILSSSVIFDSKFVVGEKKDSKTNTTVYYAALSPFYLQNKAFVDLVYNYILAIAIPFTSLVIVIISTFITVVKLRLSMEWRRETANLSSAEKKENAVTRMLIIVCYVYVVCVAPSVINAFVVQSIPDYLPTGRYSNLFYVVVALMHLLTAINSSVSFFIYYFRGSKFRSTLHSLCHCKVVKSEPVSEVATVNAEYKIYKK